MNYGWLAEMSAAMMDVGKAQGSMPHEQWFGREKMDRRINELSRAGEPVRPRRWPLAGLLSSEGHAGGNLRNVLRAKRRSRSFIRRAMPNKAANPLTRIVCSSKPGRHFGQWACCGTTAKRNDASSNRG